MAADMVQGRTLRQPLVDVGQQFLDHLFAALHRPRIAEQALVRRRQQIRVVVGRTAQHHPVEVLQVALGVVEIVDAAVEHDGQPGELLLEANHFLVAQRWNLTILFGTQPLQPRLARVHDEHRAADVGDGADEIPHMRVAVEVVDADAMFHRHRQRAGILHRLDAVGHQPRLGHQAGAESTAANPVGGAAAVQVDLIEAPLFSQPGTGRQCLRVAAAQLQRQRVFGPVVAQQPRRVAVQQRAGGDHLGVEPGALAQQPPEIAAGAIRPVQHGGDAEAVIGMGGGHGHGSMVRRTRIVHAPARCADRCLVEVFY